jgi:hypothetical protein
MFHRYITAVPTSSTDRPTRFHVFAVDRVGRVLSVSAGVAASLKSG